MSEEPTLIEEIRRAAAETESWPDWMKDNRWWHEPLRPNPLPREEPFIDGISYPQAFADSARRCPTCGSDDPRYFLPPGHMLTLSEGHYAISPCPDPFHSLVAEGK